jgi:archaellum component FlaF (FlaF/FlaG flagellin family)
MSDINKFFDERSEHNTSIQSVIHKKLKTDFGHHKISVDQSTKVFDIANLSQGSTSNLNSSHINPLIGGKALKEPSIIYTS